MFRQYGILNDLGEQTKLYKLMKRVNFLKRCDAASVGVLPDAIVLSTELIMRICHFKEFQMLALCQNKHQVSINFINRIRIISFQAEDLGYLVEFNHLLPNISMHILHITPQTFPRVLTRRICSTIKSFFNW